MERALDMARLIGMKDLAPAQGHLHHAVQAGSHHGVNAGIRSRRALASRMVEAAGASEPARTGSMTRTHIIVTRLALLALVLGAWEVLPRSGVVNPLLLPPLSEVLAMLANLLGRPTRARGGRRSRRPR